MIIHEPNLYSILVYTNGNTLYSINLSPKLILFQTKSISNSTPPPHANIPTQIAFILNAEIHTNRPNSELIDCVEPTQNKTISGKHRGPLSPK